MIRVITIEREYGSGGGVIAEKLAARLGWKLWDQMLTQEIARRMDCECHAVEKHEERKDPAYYRLLKAFMRGSHEGSQNAPRLKMVDTECVREVAQKIMPEIARRAIASSSGEGQLITFAAAPTPFTSSFTHPFTKGCAGFRQPAKVRRKRRNWRRPWTATARTSSSAISKSTGLARHCFHLMVNSAVGDDVAVDIILDAVARYGKQRA